MFRSGRVAPRTVPSWCSYVFTTVELQQALDDDGLGYMSLTQVGYRDYVYRQHLLTEQLDVSAATEQGLDARAFHPPVPEKPSSRSTG